MELVLSGKMADGGGILGCGLLAKASTVATGSATSVAGGVASSVMRLTKLELAPFSSNLRTR